MAAHKGPVTQTRVNHHPTQDQAARRSGKEEVDWSREERAIGGEATDVRT
jgi:hypothetical protein